MKLPEKIRPGRATTRFIPRFRGINGIGESLSKRESTPLRSLLSQALSNLGFKSMRPKTQPAPQSAPPQSAQPQSAQPLEPAPLPAPPQSATQSAPPEPVRLPAPAPGLLSIISRYANGEGTVSGKPEGENIDRSIMYLNQIFGIKGFTPSTHPVPKDGVNDNAHDDQRYNEEVDKAAERIRNLNLKEEVIELLKSYVHHAPKNDKVLKDALGIEIEGDGEHLKYSMNGQTYSRDDIDLIFNTLNKILNSVQDYQSYCKEVVAKAIQEITKSTQKTEEEAKELMKLFVAAHDLTKNDEVLAKIGVKIKGTGDARKYIIGDKIKTRAEMHVMHDDETLITNAMKMVGFRDEEIELFFNNDSIKTAVDLFDVLGQSEGVTENVFKKKSGELKNTMEAKDVFFKAVQQEGTQGTDNTPGIEAVLKQFNIPETYEGKVYSIEQRIFCLQFSLMTKDFNLVELDTILSHKSVENFCKNLKKMKDKGITLYNPRTFFKSYDYDINRSKEKITTSQGRPPTDLKENLFSALNQFNLDYTEERFGTKETKLTIGAMHFPQLMEIFSSQEAYKIDQQVDIKFLKHPENKPNIITHI